MIPILYPSNETAFASLGYGKLSDATECTVTEERNGEYALELKYPVNGIHYGDIAIGRIVYAVPHDGADPDGFRIYKISKPLSGIVTISAEHLSYQLSHIPVRPFTATTCPQAMTLLKTASMESNPFTFWTDKTTAATYNQTEPASIRSRLGGTDGSILDVYGGEYEFVGYTVKLWQSRGSNRGVTLRYGKNITDINEEDNIESTYTGVVPYYKSSDGTVVMPDSPVESEYADKYPFRRTKVVDLSSKFTGTTAPTKDQLTAAGQSYIKANSVGVPSVSIKVEFEPLWQTEEYKDIAPLERVWLCDTVTVYFDKLGIETSAKVTKTVYNVLKDRYDSITLGDNTNTLASALTSTDSQLAKDRASLQASISNAGSAATAYTDDRLKKQKEELEKAINAAEDRATKVASSATELAKEAQTTARSKIVTYYQADAPTSGAVNGDLWIDTDDNKLYRYDGISWTTVQDKAISEAMAAANTAQATADGKIITYYQTAAPTSGMVVGDLWIDSDDGNKMYRYSGSTWVAVQDAAISTATTLAKAAQTTANAKITTWYQASAPSSGISKGDLWIDTDDGNKLYRYDGSSWAAIQDAAISKAMTAAGTAQATADGKVVTFAQASAPSSTGLTIGDLWIDTDDNNHMYRWDGKQWAEVRDGYIDEAKSAAEAYTDAKASALQTAIDNAQKVADAATSLANVAQTTANAKITTYYQIGAPTSGMSVGDLWVDQGANNLLRRWNGSEWASVADKNISTALLNAADAQATADGKITTYAQTDAPTADMSTGDLWIDTDDGNKLYRYDGKSWTTVQDTAISAAQSLAESAKTLASSKITTYYQTTAPTADMTAGDLWIDTDGGNKLYRYSGTAWDSIQDTAIAAAMTAAGTAQATADGKVVTYAQTDAPASTGLTLGDLWIDTDDNNHMYRWDGSKWAEVRDGYIEEAKKEAEAYTDSKITEQDSKLTAAKEEITKQINASTTGYVVLQKDANGNTTELLLMDTADTATATKVWRWNQAGLAYSSTGINGTYTTAVTASGHVVADFVDTGTLTATIIKAGILASIDDNKNFWLNIQDGSFRLGAIKSIGTSNQDLLINRILNVEYGVELWRQNENSEPYIDFHSEADSPSSTTKYDYAARLSCAKSGTLQMLGTDKGDGTGHYHARLEVGGLELYQSKSSANATTAGIPYIDFHLLDTAADYTMRIAAETTDSCVIRSEGGYGAIINTKAATLTAASSRRIKTNIANISEADADKLLKLRPVSFEYTYAPGETYHGLIAEEVQEVLPELVTVPKDYDPDSTDTDPLKILRLSYTDFVPYLIKLCQAQQRKIDDLEARVAKLEEAITKS